MKDSGFRASLPKLSLRNRKPTELGKWFRANWSALLMLCFIFLLALFVRSYFAYEMSQENGYIVSGGSDSYYWRRIIDYATDTGRELYHDPLINFPDGIRNPRPPLYSMSVAVPAVLAQGLFDSLGDSTGFMFVWSTAFWGALTVVPVYMFGKEAFGRRAGLAAAFLMAFMPSHVQRSVLSNADHDAIILFFIVLTFYFLLRAIKTQQHRKFVDSWRSGASIRAGMKEYFSSSRTSVLYSLMGGMSFACIAMIWVGFAYVAVLILAYYIIQVLINRFKNIDSTAVTMIVLLSMGFGYLISFPVYYQQSLIPVRFDIPVYLFLAAIVLGLMFVLSRDFPWTISVPAIAAFFIVAIIAINFVDPSLAQAILSGQGYFVQNKLYSTIAEARAPVFSELAMSFGMVTFFMSLAGLIWVLMKIPKRATAEYIFIAVWLGAAIFMAISAGRFMFNAAPAFAIAAGWVLVIIVDRLDFGSVRKALVGASGSYLHVMRKSIKIRHVAGVLFLGFLVVLPNVWYSIDAGIPSESKQSYDLQVYESLPGFMQQGDYDAINGSNWYFGAFGYSLPLPTYYYPAAWSWFSEQDQDTYPEYTRPGYVAWWDYGFEAVQEGDHPTVADNFQNGYQISGNIIMAQSEDDAIALFAYRLITTGLNMDSSTQADLITALENHGVSYDRLHEIITMPAQDIVDEVLASPEVYGEMDADMSEANARIVAARVELASIGSDALVSLYEQVCTITGYEIRYFNVDSRMFPISGTSTGIFYAPAKLADRRVGEGNIPYDFYTIQAVDSSGVTWDLADVTSSMNIVNYQITYQEMFYDSMFYRAMCGYSGSDIGLSDDGLPGYSGSVQSYAPMPGWNMTHFRIVYRTAYYNPYPSDEVSMHSDAWVAISYADAMVLKTQISAGEVEGVVDASAYGLYKQGTVFLEYYHGAYVNGTVTTEQGYAAPGIRVTVQDEYGIPHQSVLTDANGEYSVLAPFGNVTLAISSGALASGASLVGSNVITRLKFNVTDDQAMRVKQDLDNDGVLDYLITKNHVMKGSEVSGDIFWDIDADGNYTEGTDGLIPDVTVYAQELNTGQTFSVNASEGSYDGYVPPGQYRFDALVLGTNMTMSELTNITAGVTMTLNLAVEPAMISGNVTYADGEAALGVVLRLTSLDADREFTVTTGEDGSYEFSTVLAGKYSMTADIEGKLIYNQYVSVVAGSVITRDVTLWDSSVIDIRVMNGSSAVPYAYFQLSAVFDPSSSTSGMTDQFGRVQIELPAGLWTLYASYSSGTAQYAGAVEVDATAGETVSAVVRLDEARTVSGSLKSPTGASARYDYISFETESGARIYAESSNKAAFSVVLPVGTYEVTVQSVASSGVYSGTITVTEDIDGLYLKMTSAVVISGNMWLDADSTGSLEESDLGVFAPVWMTDSYGRRYAILADADGVLEFAAPKGKTVTLTSGTPGYSGWSMTGIFAESQDSGGFLATPDPITVEGYVTYDGLGLRGIELSFLPSSIALDAVTVVTGAGGYYSVEMAPSDYTVSVDQYASLAGIEKYQYSASETLSPSADPVALDIQLLKRVVVSGTVLGAESDLVVRFSGPETLTLELGGTLYFTTYLLAGSYDVYSTGALGGQTYASVQTADVTADTRQVDVTLVQAQTVTGIITASYGTVTKAVTVSAVSEEGASATVQSSTGGSYSIVLAQGTYAMSFTLEGTEVQGTQTLYVEYYYEQVLTVGGSAVTLNPYLDTRLDNTTLSGTVLGPDGYPVQAIIQLTANTRYGIGTTIMTDPSGEFAASVQPGDYTMYVYRLQDRRVELTYTNIVRNTPVVKDIQMVNGYYLTGEVTVAGAGASEAVTVSSGGSTIKVTADQDGMFTLLVPEATYHLTSTATRTEGGMTVTYSLSESVAVDASDAYADLALVRATKRSVVGSWDSNLTMSALPGETVTYAFTVENTGNIADTYSVVYGGSGFDVTLDPAKVAIDFGTNGNTATVVAEITVGEVAAGEQAVDITLRSKTQSSVKATLSLSVNVLPTHSVRIDTDNASEAVSSTVTRTMFALNNTGNVDDTFAVGISNLDALAELGWTARIVDADTGEEVSEVAIDAFMSYDLKVEFDATRADANPEVSAVVFAYPDGYEASGGFQTVSVVLPDLVVAPGDMDVSRSDVFYEYDTSRVSLDIGLVVSLGVLIGVFFLLRRKKGMSGGGKR